MPNPSESRFASSTHTAEDLLKEQTVGLVHYSDFRKRRAEALEQQSGGSGASTPTGNESRYVFMGGTRNRCRLPNDCKNVNRD